MNTAEGVVETIRAGRGGSASISGLIKKKRTSYVLKKLDMKHVFREL